MLRAKELPYPPLDTGHSAPELDSLVKETCQGQLPGVVAARELGPRALRASLDRVTEQDELLGPPTDPAFAIEKQIIPRLKGVLGVVVEKTSGGGPRLHFDPPDGYSRRRLAFHHSNRSYMALFAVPTLAGLELDSNDMHDQAQELWTGQVDETLWSEVRLHHGRPDRPILFRDSEVAHDFQPTNLRKRRGPVYPVFYGKLRRKQPK